MTLGLLFEGFTIENSFFFEKHRRPMPKLKTKKSVKKRMKVTKNGKVKMSKAGRRHLMACKNGKRRRHLRKKENVQGGIAKTMADLMAPGL